MNTIMTDDKELESEFNDTPTHTDAPDYLQEKSDFVSKLQKEVVEAPGALEEMTPTQRYEATAHAHLSNLEKTLVEARDAGDYGSTETINDVPVELDMDFLDRKVEIPEDEKKALEEESTSNKEE